MFNTLLATTAWHDAIAVVMIHFLWQGCVIALLAELVVRGFRLERGLPRYVAYLTALLVLALCPFATLIYSNSVEQPTVAALTALSNIEQQATGFSLELATIVAPYSLWVTTFWFVGVAVLGLRFAAGVWGLRRMQASLQPVSTAISQRASQVAQRLGIERLGVGSAWSVRCSTTMNQPITFGWLRPIIVLPASLLTAQSPEVLDAVLAHELAHIRRYDLWVNTLQRVIESVLFFHPVVWRISRRVREERELCCDDIAVSLTGEPIAYATALERVASIRLGGSLATVTVAMSTGGLSYRVRRVLGFADPLAANVVMSPRLLAAGAVLASTMLLIGTTSGQWLSSLPSDRGIDAINDSSAAANIEAVVDPVTLDESQTEPFEVATDHIASAIEAPAGNPPPAAKSDKPTLRMFDTNRDGVLDDAERENIATSFANVRKERTQQFMEKYDTNKDGKLDFREKVTAWKKHHWSKHRGYGMHHDARRMQHQSHDRTHDRTHDRSLDGSIDGDQKQQSDRAPNSKHRENWRKRMLTKFDTNGNGLLDDPERRAAYAAWKDRRAQQWKAFIDRYDVDGDGRIDEHERMAIHLARVRASRTDRKYPDST